MRAITVTAAPNSLRKILNGPHGIGRNAAVQRAEHNVGELRQEFTFGLMGEITRIEALAAGDGGHLTEDGLAQCLVISAVVFNLAGTLGFSCLQAVAANLYDLLVVMSEEGMRCLDPVLIHARAARLLAPGTTPISEEQQRQLLKQLKQIVAHFRDTPDPCNKAACVTCPAKTACA